MTLNKLINDAIAISRKYTSGDIPLVICGTEVDITLSAKGEDGKYYIEMNYMPTPKEKPKEGYLNNAVERYIEQHKSELNGYFDIRRIARHFFELGLIAQKL